MSADGSRAGVSARRNSLRQRSLEFLAARRKAGYTLWLSEKGVAPLLAYLRQVGAAPILVPTAHRRLPMPAGAVPHLPGRRTWPGARNRGGRPARGSIVPRRPALKTWGSKHSRPPRSLPSSKSKCQQRSAAYVTTGLRAFLRFCHVTGRTPRPLAQAVPKVASWRLAALPKAVDPATVRALLSSCDRRTTAGRRDFAVLLVLSRLGLRSGEVASLCLEDIDWRTGELVVRGKGPQVERLPLPADVGEAIAAWLRRGTAKLAPPGRSSPGSGRRTER